MTNFNKFFNLKKRNKVMNTLLNIVRHSILQFKLFLFKIQHVFPDFPTIQGINT